MTGEHNHGIYTDIPTVRIDGNSVKVTSICFEEEHRYIGLGCYGDVFTGRYNYSFVATGNGYSMEGSITLKEELMKSQAEQRIKELLSNGATQS